MNFGIPELIVVAAGVVLGYLGWLISRPADR